MCPQKFSLENETHLIELVSKQPELYITPSNYTGTVSTKTRNERWKQIADDLGVPHLTATDCKARWRILRDRYKMKQRQLYITNPSEKVKIKSWPHWDKMGFLDTNQSRDRPRASSPPEFYAIRSRPLLRHRVPTIVDKVVISDSDCTAEEMSSGDEDENKQQGSAVDKHADETVDKRVDEPVDKHVDESEDKRMDEPVDKPVDEHEDKSVNVPAEDSDSDDDNIPLKKLKLYEMRKSSKNSIINTPPLSELCENVRVINATIASTENIDDINLQAVVEEIAKERNSPHQKKYSSKSRHPRSLLKKNMGQAGTSGSSNANEPSVTVSFNDNTKEIDAAEMAKEMRNPYLILTQKVPAREKTPPPLEQDLKVKVPADKEHIMAFFRNVGETVMKFSPLIATEAKLRVMRVVSELELQHIHAEASKWPNV